MRDVALLAARWREKVLTCASAPSPRDPGEASRYACAIERIKSLTAGSRRWASKRASRARLPGGEAQHRTNQDDASTHECRNHLHRRRGKRILFIVFALLILFVVAELLAFACGVFLQSKYKMYSVPVVQHSDAVKSYDDYLKLRNPRLGWPLAGVFGGDFFDASGARYSPAFRDPAQFPNRVAIFGDSYAAGSEVDDAHAWGNVLAASIGARVGIFGVPGYGTDQAYLRFLTLDQDPSQVVILTHLSEDIVRNLTRDWDLITHLGYYGMKPRFVLDRNGALQEVPPPDLTERQYFSSVGIDKPLVPMQYENFQPGGPAGVTALSFPFTVSVLRNLGSYQMRSLLARRPDYAEFYEKGHALQGLEITTKILESFRDEAKKRGKVPLVVLLATRQDFNYFRRTGQWTYAPLVEALNQARVDYIDFGPILLKYIGNREIPEFFKPLGHYNEEASKLLADTVLESMQTRGAVPH